MFLKNDFFFFEITVMACLGNKATWNFTKLAVTYARERKDLSTAKLLRESPQTLSLYLRRQNFCVSPSAESNGV